MKKLLYIFLLFTIGANAQSISNQVISNYGLSATNVSAQTDVTIGELVVKTMSDGNNTLTNGIHQTKLLITTIYEDELTNNYQVFPNPSKEGLNFNYNNTANSPVNLQLFDISGKLLWRKNNVMGNEQIKMQSQPTGTYILKVNDGKQQELKTIKVIKTL